MVTTEKSEEPFIQTRIVVVGEPTFRGGYNEEPKTT